VTSCYELITDVLIMNRKIHHTTAYVAFPEITLFK